MFYLFAGHDYCPEGRFYDFKGSFINIDLAIGRLNEITNEALTKKDYQSEIQWFQVVRIEHDGHRVVADGWAERRSKSFTHGLHDVTTSEDKSRRVAWVRHEER